MQLLPRIILFLSKKGKESQFAFSEIRGDYLQTYENVILQKDATINFLRLAQRRTTPA